MKYLMKNVTVGVILISMIISFTIACDKKPALDDKILGTWRITKANIHSIYSFRANGSWTASKRVEGRFSKIVESRGKIDGQWEVVESEEEGEGEDVLYLVMTPSKVESDKEWEEGVAVRFKIIMVDEKELSLISDTGRPMKLIRVRGKKASEGGDEEGIVKINTGPVVVNLRRDRAHGKFRYLCIALELSVEEADSFANIAVEKNQETGEVKYTLHPKVKDVAIMFFSSLTYKDTKTLDKVKKVVKDFQVILNPYLDGKLVDIYVVKVVVTTNVESVKEFEIMNEPEESAVEE